MIVPLFLTADLQGCWLFFCFCWWCSYTQNYHTYYLFPLKQNKFFCVVIYAYLGYYWKYILFLNKCVFTLTQTIHFFPFIYSLGWLIKINCYKEFIDPKLFVNMCVFSVCLSLTLLLFITTGVPASLLFCFPAKKKIFQFFWRYYYYFFCFHYMDHCSDNSCEVWSWLRYVFYLFFIFWQNGLFLVVFFRCCNIVILTNCGMIILNYSLFQQRTPQLGSQVW